MAIDEAEDARKCAGTTKRGTRCTRWARKGAEYCPHHGAAREIEASAQVVSIAQRIKTPLDVESREERMAWLDRVRRGVELEQKVSPRGDVIEVMPSTKDRIAAAALLERMMSSEEDDTAKVLDDLADRVRARLGIA